MKKQYKVMLLLSAMLLCGVTSYAQDDTEYLLDGGIRFSGFGGPLIEFSSINGDLAVSSGGGGAALLNNRFFFGGYGMGLTNEVNFTLENQMQVETEMGHGGMWLGGIIKPNKILHFGVSTKLGWGSIDTYDVSFTQRRSLGDDDIFVVTPQVEMELNVARWFKINVGAGYRKVIGVEETMYQATDFDSGVVTLGFLFGWF